jgi:hypothetical protein
LTRAGNEPPVRRPAIARHREKLRVIGKEHLLEPVVGERLDGVRAGVHELSVQGGDLGGMIEHGLGNERPGLEVAATLQLEEIALSTDHRSGGEPLGDARRRNGGGAVGHRGGH